MAATSPGRVFISYRRQETAWPARQLYELLVTRFGPEQVFKDVDSIQPGDDFVEKITEAVGSCDVLLALIGPLWLDMLDEDGRRRLDNEDDFVRLELRAALSRGVRVVPILVDGARMPQASELPEELASLGRRQAVAIDPVGFNTDRLMATLTEALGSRPAGSEPMPAAPVPGAGPVDLVDLVEPPVESEAPALPVLVELLVEMPPESEPAVTGGDEPPAAGRTPPPRTPDPAPDPAPRRPMGLVLGAVAAVAVIGVALVLHPWSSGGERAGGTPTGPASSPSTSGSPSGSPSSTVAASTEPTVLAHRGGLEEHQFETQEAMEAAAVAGYAVETDVRYTSDGVAVLVHDEQATKGLDCGGQDLRVSKTTWDTLRATCHSKPTAADKNTYDIPTFAATMEGIAAASPTAWVFAEVKVDQTAAQDKAFLATLIDNGLRDRSVVTSSSLDRLVNIHKADATMPLMLFVSGKQVAASSLTADDLWAVAVEQSVATKAYVDQLHAIGVKVVVWVLNDETQWAQAKDIAADLVLTDYPAKYTAWAASH